MRKICLECGEILPKEPLFVLDNAPASAQDIPDESELAEDEGISLSLYQCPHCGLVQFDAEPVAYFRDVIRAGGLSSTMRELRRSQYQHLIDTYHLEGRRFIEVGCGGGEFLKVLTEFPVKAYGIEHKEDLVKKAQNEGLNVWEDFPETADDTFDGAPYDVFLSFNFLEHQPQPSIMLQAIYNNLTDEGYGLVTVPALEYIANRGTYYELIHDHLAYYSAKTLRRLMEENGFMVLEEETINRDTLSVIVKKIPGFVFPPAEADVECDNAKTNGYVDINIASEIGADNDINSVIGIDTGSSVNIVDDVGADTDIEIDADTDIYTDSYANTDIDIVTDTDISLAQSLTSGYHKVLNEIEALIVLLRAAGKKLALWGAGHQGFTLASTTALGDYAEYIIDSAPFKQGRFAPASHLPIVPPEYFNDHPVNAILIVAPGYTEEIAEEIRDRYGENVNIFALRSDAIEDLS